MKRIVTVLAGAALALSGMVLSAPQAAADITCNGTIGASTYDDDIVVRSGATCTLNGTRTDGNIKVYSGGTLVASGVRVDGNIQSEGHRSVTVTGSTVNGNIQLESGGAVSLGNNRVGGDIQLFSNRSGAKSITGNTVDGNLQCKSNTPAPTGGNNTVRGNKEDQCRNLTGGGGGGGSTGPGTGQDGSNVDIYINAGRWSKGGREWTTECGKYSSVIDRCTTRIWATQVTREGGRYVTRSGWYFNNLTYKPVPRSAWAGNPLGANGVYKGTASWVEDGRQWRTECDTALTGNGGCRSFITASVIERSGNSYRTVTKEVFNNMVRFSN